MRMREDSERLPKPMIPVGDRPILWHIMRYYAAFGHKDFIVCLGYRAEAIKDYFLNYNEALSNDFILRDGGRDVELLERDIDDWSITFVNTGLQASIGERLRAVERHLDGEEMFLANYGDVLTDAPLPKLIAVDDAIPALVEEKRVLAYPYDGFWAPMDTLKDKQMLEGLVASGQAPWTTPAGVDLAAVPDEA